MERDDLVFKAKLAEQAERCADRRVVIREGGFRKRFFFFSFLVSLFCCGFCTQSTNFSERIVIAGESLFIFFTTLYNAKRREVNARRTRAISRARNTCASVGWAFLFRERESERPTKAFRKRGILIFFYLSLSFFLRKGE